MNLKSNKIPIPFKDILINGTNFWPAYKHYGQTTNVMCDRCGADELLGSIGYGDYDICYWCAADVADTLKNIESDSSDDSDTPLLKHFNYPPGKK